jgi:hypothetical protein
VPGRADGFAGEVGLGMTFDTFEACDVSGDGILDLVGFVTDSVTGLRLVEARLGEGNGQFGGGLRSPSTEGTRSGYGMALGDMNGDAMPDIVIQDAVHLNLGEGRFGAARPLPESRWTQPVSNVLADVDRDGLLDVVQCSSSYLEPVVFWFPGRGDGTVSEPRILLDGMSGPITFGDIDGDGLRDLVVGAPITAIALGHPAGGFDAPIMHGGALGALAVGEVNGDGRPDVLSTHAALLNLGVTIDRTAPLVEVQSPAGGERWIVGHAYPVRWTAADESGVSSVMLYRRRAGDPGSQKWLTQTPVEQRLWQWTPVLADTGTIEIEVEVRDPRGNVGIGGSAAFRVLPPDSVIELRRFDVAATDSGLFVEWAVGPPEEIAAVVLQRTELEGERWVTKTVADLLPLEGRMRDVSALPGRRYGYALRVRTVAGTSRTHESIWVDTPVVPSPIVFDVSVRPNPARGRVGVEYRLPFPGRVSVRAYDLAGREVAAPFEGISPAGSSEHTWGSAEHGIAPGLYFVRVVTPFGERTRRVVVLPGAP